MICVLERMVFFAIEITDQASQATAGAEFKRFHLE